MTRLFLAPSAMLSLLLSGPVLAQQAKRVVNAGTSEPECTFHVNYDRNADMPGYLVHKSGRRLRLPFTPTNQLVPADYKGRDVYTEEFTDLRIRARWAECRKNPACANPVIAGAKGFVAYEERNTGTVDPVGKIDPEGEVNLKGIRRPAYFGKAPYQEPIAEVEPRTQTVKFTVPGDSYERLHLKKEDPIKLRGWHLEGEGIDNGAGQRVEPSSS